MVHIFHHYDADGFASAAVIIRFLKSRIDAGELVQTYSCEHTKPMDFSSVDVLNDTIYIVDYSFTNPKDVESVIELFDKCMRYLQYQEELNVLHEISLEAKIEFLKKHLIWIDHHASSQKLMDDYHRLSTLAKAGCVHPENVYAGCMLTWLYLYAPASIMTDKLNVSELSYFISAECPMWIQYVDDHDKWAHRIENSQYFVTGVTCTNNGLWNNFLNPSGSYATYVSKGAPGITKKFVRKGKVIEEYRKGENYKRLKSAGFCVTIECDGTQIHALALNAVGNSTLFGDAYEKFDAVIPFSFNGKVWKYSIFSHPSKEFPVNKIAEMYKDKFGITGGGHQHAAGWASPKCIFDGDEAIKEITPYQG